MRFPVLELLEIVQKREQRYMRVKTTDGTYLGIPDGFYAKGCLTVFSLRFDREHVEVEAESIIDIQDWT